MKSLYFYEMYPDMALLFKTLEHRGLFRDAMIDDPGYALHLWMTEAFGPLSPKPFRIFGRKGSPIKVLAYSYKSGSSLLTYLKDYTSPALYKVCPPENIAFKKMPNGWKQDRKLDFEVFICPVVRRKNVEKDAFLAALDHQDLEEPLFRHHVYSKWLECQMKPGAKLLNAKLDGFRLQPLIRRRNRQKGRQSYAKLIRPACLMSGTLRIISPEKFSLLLGRGVGRHRAFGFGMLLLRPHGL